MTDTTIAARQQKRLSRMQERGVTRTTIMVHEDCRPALELLRPQFADPAQAEALGRIAYAVAEGGKPVNVSQVRQLSPFRYPGGKTWLVPEVRRWLAALPARPPTLIEPFAGGAIVGLTAASEHLVDRVILSELDDGVSAVWSTVVSGTDEDAFWLFNRILTFEVTLENVRAALDTPAASLREEAFKTIIRNRMQRGGILAPGASLMKAGENGKGLLSRWYPETLVTRMTAIRQFRGRLNFLKTDAFEVIQANMDTDAAWFVDPPYTAGGKRAGSRLYSHPDLDHARLFEAISHVRGPAMLTYDDAPEVRALAHAFGFNVCQVPMKNTHHAVMQELLILKDGQNN